MVDVYHLATRSFVITALLWLLLFRVDMYALLSYDLAKIFQLLLEELTPYWEVLRLAIFN